MKYPSTVNGPTSEKNHWFFLHFLESRSGRAPRGYSRRGRPFGSNPGGVRFFGQIWAPLVTELLRLVTYQ